MKKHYLSAFTLSLLAAATLGTGRAAAQSASSPVRTVADVAVASETVTGKDVFIVLGSNLGAQISTDDNKVTGKPVGSLLRIVTVDAAQHLYKIYDVKSGKWIVNKGGTKAEKKDAQVELSNTPTEWYIVNNNNGNDATLLDLIPKAEGITGYADNAASWNFFGGYSAGKVVGFYDASDGNSAWRLYDPKAIVKRSVEVLKNANSTAAETAINEINAGTSTTEWAAAIKKFHQALDGKQVRFYNSARDGKRYLTLGSHFTAAGNVAGQAAGAEDAFVLKYNADADNFSLKHAVTGRNLQALPGYNAGVPTSTAAGAAYAFPATAQNEAFSIQSLATGGSEAFLHMSGNAEDGNKRHAVRWKEGNGNDNDASTWKIEASNVDENALLEAAKARFVAIEAPSNLGHGLGQVAYGAEYTALLQTMSNSGTVTLSDMQTLLNAAADGKLYTVNLPKGGEFFRIKSNDGTRLVTAAGAGTGAWQLQLTKTADENTIFCYDAQQHLTSFTTGRGVYLHGDSKARLADYTEQQQGTVTFKALGDKYGVILDVPGRKATMHLWQQDDKMFVDGSGGENTGNVLTHLRLESVTALPVHFNTAGLATMYAPAALEVPSGVNVYVGKQYDSAKKRLFLEAFSGNVIPANTAVILEGTAGNTVDFTIHTGTAPAAVATNALHGGAAPVKLEAGKSAQVLSGNQFSVLSGQMVRAFRAYLEDTAASGATRPVELVLPGLTGIDAARTVAPAEAPVYDLAGRRVEKLVPGQVYVQQGRKFVQQ